MAWTNEDGLVINFGTERAAVNKTGTSAASVVQTLIVDLDWTDITTVAAHTGNISARDAFIPAGAAIKSAIFSVSEAFTSGGSATLGIGTGTVAGVAIDADGVDATVAKTALDAIGDQVQCDGAQVGSTLSVGTADAYIYFTTGTAAWTAGAGRLVVEYITDGQ
jgi:hypothetical protein